MRIDQLELRNTVKPMLSDNYKDRIIAEFWQTFIRYRRLCNALNGWHYTINCGGSRREEIEELGIIMADYLHILLKRAVREDIDLFSFDFSVNPVYKYHSEEPTEVPEIEQLRKLSKEWADKQPEILRYTGDPIKDSISRAEEEILGSKDLRFTGKPLRDAISRTDEEILESIDRGKKS